MGGGGDKGEREGAMKERRERIDRAREKNKEEKRDKERT